MTWTLISATPSPYARKVRIALQEKNLPFTLQTEVPWDSTTQTPQYNPLEKLPVLLFDDGHPAIYESHYILEWLEAKHPEPALLPEGLEERLFAKQVEVVADGICDALVLLVFEGMREREGKGSEPWKARQMRKVDGGLQALAEWVEKGGGRHIVGDRLTLADVATCAVLGFMQVRFPDIDWGQRHPVLQTYFESLDERPSFANTRPSPQTYKDKIV
ncbi:glutathione S-transferase [Polychaeton citri CBS 116435]|uniref:Glutathione S-transferase n=1 Tax=Polychaeton citri CBS 116435 TaxID=1314669 RepID=A0A9P4UPW5_9PEZI|nr:glutathione S-transferase [Polychaeton citri CBS 116435]